MNQTVHKFDNAEQESAPANGTAVSADIAITVETQLSKTEPVWRSFENVASGHVFQSFDWVSIWHSAIGRHRRISPQIVIGRAPGGTVLFLLPFGTGRKHGLTTLEWLGGDEAHLKTGLFDRAFLRDLKQPEWASLWQRILAVLPAIDVIHLDDQPDSLDGLSNPFALFKTHRHAEQMRGTRLHGDWESYCESKRPSATPGEISEPAATLSPPSEDLKSPQAPARTAELRFEVIHDPERIAELLQKLFADKAKLLKRRGVPDPFADTATRTFYWRQAQRMYPHGSGYLSTLTLDGKVIGVNWGLIFRGRFYYLLSAYDTKLRRVSPRKRQVNEVVRWCLEHGLEHLAFGVGEGNNYRWCEERMELFAIINGRTFKGRVAALLLGLNARLRKNTRTSMTSQPFERDMRVLGPPGPSRA